MEKKGDGKLTIGIVGLGLIGASLAGALSEAGYRVLGHDADKTTEGFALIARAVNGDLTDENISECDAILIAVSQKNAINWLRENSEKISKKALVIDCCGVKRKICAEGWKLAEKNGFYFMGGHPMAGKQTGGIKSSRSDLFKNAVFCLVPQDGNDIRLMSKAKDILKDAGFSKFILMTPEEHDQVIAFTSQMAHLLSNAYIKSDMAKVGSGAVLSGGAFRDMTRVAYLDEKMWTELFMDNRDNLLSELDGFIVELQRYKEAISSGDQETLSALLTEGKKRKEIIEEEISK